MAFPGWLCRGLQKTPFFLACLAAGPRPWVLGALGSVIRNAVRRARSELQGKFSGELAVCQRQYLQYSHFPRGLQESNQEGVCSDFEDGFARTHRAFCDSFEQWIRPVVDALDELRRKNCIMIRRALHCTIILPGAGAGVDLPTP